MTHRHRSHLIKGALLALWIATIAVIYFSIHAQGIHLRELPRAVRGEVREAGTFGPLVILGLYLAATIIPFPMAAVAILSGSLYGPWWGSVLVVLGVNLASAVSFFLGRFFGRHFIDEHKNPWLKSIDQLMENEGVYAIFLLRLVFIPHDVLSLGAGMTQISFRQYMLGTFFGILPGTVTFVVLGEAFTDPRAWVLFGALLLGCLAGAIWLRQSRWAKAHIFKHVEPQTYE